MWLFIEHEFGCTQHDSTIPKYANSTLLLTPHFQNHLPRRLTRLKK